MLAHRVQVWLGLLLVSVISIKAWGEPVQYTPFELLDSFDTPKTTQEHFIGGGKLLFGRGMLFMGKDAVWMYRHVFTDDVTMRIRMQLPAPKPDTPSVTRIYFGTRDRGLFLKTLGAFLERTDRGLKIRLVRQRHARTAVGLADDDQTTDPIARLDSVPSLDGKLDQMLEWKARMQSGRLQLYCNGELLLTGYCDNQTGASVKQVGMHHTGSPLKLDEVEIRGVTMSSFTPAHHRLLRDAEEARAEIDQRVERGEFKEAWRFTKRYEELLNAIYGEDTIVALQALTYARMVLIESGELEAALQVCESRKAKMAKLLGEDHPVVGGSQVYVAMALARLERDAEALSAQRDAYNKIVPYATPECYQDYRYVIDSLLIALSNNQLLATRDGDIQRRAALDEEFLEITRRHDGDDHHNTRRAEAFMDCSQRFINGDDEALQRWQQMELNHLEGGRLANLTTEDRQKAIPMLEAAIKDQRELLGDKHMLTLMAMRQLARQYYEVGDEAQREKSFRVLKLLLKLWEEVTGKGHEYYSTLNGMAVQVKERGDHERAARMFTEIREFYADNYDRFPDDGEKFYARSLLNEGVSLVEAGRLDEAELQLHRGIAMLGEPHDAYWVSQKQFGLAYLAILYAKQTYDKSFWHHFGRLIASTGDIETMTDSPDRWSVRVGCMIKILGSQQDVLTALAMASPLLFQQRFGDQHPLSAWRWHRHALLEWLDGDVEEAAKQMLEVMAHHATYQHVAYRRAVNLAQQGMARRYFQVARDDALSIPPEYMSTDDLYGEVLQWKGSVFDRQRALNAAWQSPQLKKNARQLDHLASRFATQFARPIPDAAVPKLIKTMEQREALETRLSASRVGEIETHGLQALVQLRDHIPEDVAIVDYVSYQHRSPNETNDGWISEPRLTAFVIRHRKTVVRIDLGPVKDVVAACHAWVDALLEEVQAYETPEQYAAFDRQQLEAATDQLAARIWDPIYDHVFDANTILYSPDASFANIPVHALPGDLPGTVLLQKHAFVVIPSTKWLDEVVFRNPRTEEPAARMLIAGGIAYNTHPDKARSSVRPRVGPQYFTDVPKSEQFSAALGKKFMKQHPRGNLKTLLNEEATERNFRRDAVGQSYIHVHTHGFFIVPQTEDRTRTFKRPIFDRSIEQLFLFPGMRSGIALSGANLFANSDYFHDGILWAEELASTNLQTADLVVLAACSSAAGEELSDQGVMGLQTGLHLAGARSTLGSLWPVGNNETMQLMALFYDNLWTEGQSKGEALRQAQLKLRTHYDSRASKLKESGSTGRPLPVFFWAPFILSGDWQ
ncbi:MAG: CHAT domain-containing protein [Planctomycetota bacterium]